MFNRLLAFALGVLISLPCYSGLEDWSTTAASNASVGSIDFSENQAPNTVNDSARALMADVRTFYNAIEWRDWGHTPVYSDADTFTVSSASDLSSIYTVGRRFKATDSSTLYGIITASSYAASTQTVDVALDSGSLSASLTNIALGFDPTSSPIVRPVYGISAYRTTNQDHDSGSSGTWDPIIYNVTTNGFNHGTTLNTTTGLITAPAWATYWRVNATTGFAAHATGDYRGIALATSTASNGSTIFEYGDRKVPAGTIADYLRVSTGWVPTSYVSAFYVMSYQSSLTSLAQSSAYMRLYVEFK